eukprot:4386613-Alexandrium_andersonii.AAC.1
MDLYYLSPARISTAACPRRLISGRAKYDARAGCMICLQASTSVCRKYTAVRAQVQRRSAER